MLYPGTWNTLHFAIIFNNAHTLKLHAGVFLIALIVMAASIVCLQTKACWQ